MSGYVCVPLAQGTKRPLIQWAPYRYARPDAKTQVQIFADFPKADIGIITGKLSNIMVLDYDKPPFLPGGLPYTTTPNGRHYYFRYHEGDAHAIGVKPNIDIPILVKAYSEPTIIEQRIPIQPNHRANKPEPQSSFIGTAPPPFHAITECEFIKWFQEKRLDPNWEGRYPLARAYASNVAHCSSPDKSLGPNYQHESTIYNSVKHPIRCATIVEGGFPCPFFDEWSTTCKKAAGVTTPYGLANRTTKENNKCSYNSTTASNQEKP